MKKLILILISAYFLISCSPKNSYNSYKTLESFKLDSVDGEVTQLIHKRSGAQLVLVKNKDLARSFMASFRTPPYDDTGLFHIFEHAVLAGSRLYPSKSNFFNVSKSSVASFTNAITSSVSTFYPFVTRDPKDFDNLLSVYMDAVFFPKVIKDPRIIKREGWRYEIHPETKKMSINGIVFSEMKGSFAAPDHLLWMNLNRSLLPQTPYAYSSGGLPEQIASLRFEQIVEAYKKYYHPQNSLICLYGDIDFKKTLTTMDTKFLSHFNKAKDFKRPEIPMQKDFNYPSSPLKASYPGPKGSHKDFVAKGYVLGQLTPLEKDAVSVMLEAFASNSIAPLKLRILKEGLATSVSHSILEGKDNALAFVFKGTENSKIKSLGDVLQEEIDKVIYQGLDQELLTSILNKYEFSHKEKNNQALKGLSLSWDIKLHWLYPDRPLAQELDFVRRFKKLKKLFNNKTFVKRFFQKHFKKNPRSLWLVLQPDPLFSEKFNKALEERITTALKIKPLSNYEKEDKVYRQWVAAKESPEITDKTPLLKLSDIKAEENPIPFNKSKTESSKIIEYPQSANGISYIKLFFDLRGVEEKNLKNLKLFTRLLKKTETDNYSFQELSRQIGTYIGGMSFDTRVYQSFKNTKEFKPLMEVSLRFLNKNRGKSMALLKELLVHSQFSPTDRVQNLLDEMKTEMSNSISYRAWRLALISAKKNFFPNQVALVDETSGGAFEKYMLKSKKVSKQLVPEFKLMLKDIFNQSRLYLITITADQKELKTLKTEVVKLKQFLPAQGSKDQKWSFSKQKNYQGYAIPGEVQYVVETTSFKEQGLKYSGSLDVYSKYLDTHFMLPRFREQAGAYGAQSFAKRDGLWTLLTYKDPNLKKSFGVFSQAVDFMKNENLNQEKLKPAILGSLKTFYKDRSVSEKSDWMTYLYLSDLSWNDYIQTKKEILATTPKNFQKISQALTSSLKKSQKAVAGNPDKIKKEAPFLKEILSLP